MTTTESSPRHALLAAVDEPAWQRQVVEWAQRGGWKIYHTHDSRRSPAGFPDLVLVKPGRRVIFAELKRERGQLTAEQRVWLETLRECPATDVRVWRPSDEREVRSALDVEP